MTVVDFVSKTAYFIPNHTTDCHPDNIVRLFLHYMWKLHNLPNCIVLDKGLQFVILFTKELYCLLRVKIAYFIAWYSQWDRQTECIN